MTYKESDMYRRFYRRCMDKYTECWSAYEWHITLDPSRAKELYELAMTWRTAAETNRATYELLEAIGQ